MSLRAGAETVVEQCLDVQPGEKALVINDGNDRGLVDALLDALDERTPQHDLLEYEERERHGEEPPKAVARAMRDVDVFIAPTRKSISHTRARREACSAGSRGASMPGIDRDIWSSSLMADYDEVAELSDRVLELLRRTEEVRVETPSGTDLSLEVDERFFKADTGLIHDPGDFGNLPAGEAFGAPVNASGTLVVDHFPFAPEGTVIEIEDNRAVAVEHPGEEGSELAEAFEDVEDARNVAEFGVGTNPEASLIGNVLQDEKVLGTVHVAFGDNTSMVPEGNSERVESEVHWDTVCEDPTVRFDGERVIREGDPVFT